MKKEFKDQVAQKKMAHISVRVVSLTAYNPMVSVMHREHFFSTFCDILMTSSGWLGPEDPCLIFQCAWEHTVMSHSGGEESVSVSLAPQRDRHFRHKDCQPKEKMLLKKVLRDENWVYLECFLTVGTSDFIYISHTKSELAASLLQGLSEKHWAVPEVQLPSVKCVGL